MVRMTFSGFQMDACAFFTQIAQNNNKAFFEENRTRFYRVVRDPMRMLAAALADTALQIDERFEARPERVVARIRRDTRFTRDKTLYRDHLWGSFRHADRDIHPRVELYFCIDAQSVSWGLSCYGWPPSAMAQLRGYIMENLKRFAPLAQDQKVQSRFCLLGEDYKRLPPVCDGAPLYALDWLKKKHVYLEHEEPFFPGATQPELAERIAADFRLLAPLYAFLDASQAHREKRV